MKDELYTSIESYFNRNQDSLMTLTDLHAMTGAPHYKILSALGILHREYKIYRLLGFGAIKYTHISNSDEIKNKIMEMVLSI